MADYLSELFSLKGKVAAITGAGGLLCGEMALAFGKVGVKVAVLDINFENAQEVAERVISEGGDAFAFQEIRMKSANGKCGAISGQKQVRTLIVWRQWGHQVKLYRPLRQFRWYHPG